MERKNFVFVFFIFIDDVVKREIKFSFSFISFNNEALDTQNQCDNIPVTSTIIYHHFLSLIASKICQCNRNSFGRLDDDDEEDKMITIIFFFFCFNEIESSVTLIRFRAISFLFLPNIVFLSFSMSFFCFLLLFA